MKQLLKEHTDRLLLAYFLVFFSFNPAHARQPELTDILGNSASIIRDHTSVETAMLKVVAVEASRKHALLTHDRIAGYPVIGNTSSPDKDKAIRLANLVLSKNSYIDIRQRCKNKKFYGVRFMKEDKIVELAVGTPCNQVIVVFKNKNGTRNWWGSTFGKEAMAQL
ncbi:MAG TPA: hypothetical protein ENJ08_15255 [Gammaproteobacteria bacterium]|nr:hypothetical protein [Gammaproteobacteria bacterium]